MQTKKKSKHSSGQLASLVRQALVGIQSSTPAPRLGWRGSSNKASDAWSLALLLEGFVPKSWEMSQASPSAALQCSSWTKLANDRNLGSKLIDTLGTIVKLFHA